jgi:hypothetical protein
MKLMYINKAVLKFNNSQPWQANKKNQIVRDACMHQVLQPNLNIVLGGKKSKLQHVDFVYTWMAVPFFLGTFSRLRGENRTKKSLDMLCIFDFEPISPVSRVILPGFSPPD